MKILLQFVCISGKNKNVNLYFCTFKVNHIDINVHSFEFLTINWPLFQRFEPFHLIIIRSPRIHFSNIFERVPYSNTKSNQNIVYFSEYTIFANITKSARGFPRLIYDDHTYGLQYGSYIEKEKNTWTCTGSELLSRKRCLASVKTKIFDGFAMLRVHNTNHICKKTKKNHWSENLTYLYTMLFLKFIISVLEPSIVFQFVVFSLNKLYFCYWIDVFIFVFILIALFFNI